MSDWVTDDANLYGRAMGLGMRGRHKTVGTAFDAALKDLLTERNSFFDMVASRWAELFPGLPARPGRTEAGKLFLYVRTASALFMMRPRLRSIAATLATLPGAPKRVELRLEIRSGMRCPRQDSSPDGRPFMV